MKEPLSLWKKTPRPPVEKDGDTFSVRICPQMLQAIDIQQIDRSGQVAVLGVPNSGKSSLVNELVGMKAWELGEFGKSCCTVKRCDIVRNFPCRSLF